MSNTENVALIDLDDTLADFTGTILNDFRKTCNPKDIDEVNLTWIHGDDRPAWIRERKRLIMTQSGWWAKLPLLDSGNAVLRMLAAEGYRIIFATAPAFTAPNSATEKIEWIRKHYPEYPDIHITRVKEGTYGRILMDDFPGYIDAWLKVRPRGLVLIPLQEWNKDYRHPNAIHIEPDLSNMGDLRRAAKEAMKV